MLPMVVGRALKSTVLIMGELGSIGSDVLKTHDVYEIDIDAWYPAKLRQEIHEAAYKRFGAAALLNFGFSMGDYYSQALVEVALERYQSLMASESNATEALDWFISHLTNAYNLATSASQKCEGVRYGFFSKPMQPLVYEFNAVSTLLAHHESFSEGIIQGYLVRHIAHQWDFELTFRPERTVSDAKHSSFFWTCAFKPKAKSNATAEVTTAAYSLQIKETLFKKVLDESNATLATLMSSVRYARLIQEAQLPNTHHVRSKLQQFAVEWHPRDTIGGDFWWSIHDEPSNSLVIALVDCAGHGVPGAMLSVLVNSQLEKIFSNQASIDLSEALMQLDHHVRMSLRQDQQNSESDDGCDAALVRIHLSTRSIEYVGAKINLYELDSNGNIEQHKADRISLGYRDMPSSRSVTKKWQAAPGSRLILVTDGVTDQLGGTKHPPLAFGYKRLLEALTAASHVPAAHMATELLSAVNDWQGTQSRRDDLTILIFEI